MKNKKLKLKEVQANRMDTCLTFVLKRLGVADKYRDVEGVEFVEKFNLIKIDSFENVDRGDIIVTKSKRDYYTEMNLRIDKVGRIFSEYRNNSLHFMLFEGDAISDFNNQDGIGYYPVNFFNPSTSKSTYHIIKHSELISKL